MQPNANLSCKIQIPLLKSIVFKIMLAQLKTIVLIT